MGNSDLDATKAAEIVKKHAITLHGNLASFSFKALEIKPNSAKDTWYVICEFLATARESEPAKYKCKVNVSTGNIESFNIVK